MAPSCKRMPVPSRFQQPPLLDPDARPKENTIIPKQPLLPPPNYLLRLKVRPKQPPSPPPKHFLEEIKEQKRHEYLDATVAYFAKFKFPDPT